MWLKAHNKNDMRNQAVKIVMANNITNVSFNKKIFWIFCLLKLPVYANNSLNNNSLKTPACVLKL